LSFYCKTEEYTYLFIPSDQRNVKIVQGTITLADKIVPAEVSIETAPLASAIKFGQSLSDSILTGGVSNNSQFGTFTWKDPDNVPSAGEVGTNQYVVVYTPTTDKSGSTLNKEFKVKEFSIPLTVGKADIHFEDLKAEEVPYGSTLEDIPAPTARKAYYTTKVKRESDGEIILVDQEIPASAYFLEWMDTSAELAEQDTYECRVLVTLDDAYDAFVSTDNVICIVHVKKIKLQPAVNEETYGSITSEPVVFGTRLADIKLPLYNEYTMLNPDGVAVEGTFEWADPNIYPGEPNQTMTDESGTPLVIEQVKQGVKYYYYRAVFKPHEKNYQSTDVYFCVMVKKASGSQYLSTSKAPYADPVASDTQLSKVNLISDGVEVYLANYYKPVTIESSQEFAASTSALYTIIDGRYVKATQYSQTAEYYARKAIPGTFGWADPSIYVNSAISFYSYRFTPAEGYEALIDVYTMPIVLVVYTSSSTFVWDVVSEEDKTIVIKGFNPDDPDTSKHEILYFQEKITDGDNEYTVIGIKDGAFKGKTEIKKVTLPSTVTYIGNDAFNGCISLTEINLPTSLVRIGDRAFEGCVLLETVQMNSACLTTIGSFAFHGDVRLTSLVIPGTIESIGEAAFAECDSLTDLQVEANDYYQLVDTNGTMVLLKDGTTLHTYFSSNAALNYVIDEAVTTIGSYAFSYNTNLMGKVIAPNVDVIEEYAFAFSKLKYVYFVQDIDKNKVNSSTFARIFTGTNGIVIYGPTVYDEVKEEYTSNLMSYCDTIANLTFVGHTKVDYLSLVTMNGTSFYSSVDEFGNATIYGFASGVFRKAEGLTSEEFENGTYNNGIEELTDVTFYQAVKDPVTKTYAYVVATLFEDTDYYYYDTQDMAALFASDAQANGEFIIPARIPKKYYSAISAWDGDYATVTRVEGFANTGIKKLVIPNTVTEIGDKAFEYCKKLTEVTLSSNLLVIGDNAFSECSALTNIVIPASVYSIGVNAFSGCTALMTATFESDVVDYYESEESKKDWHLGANIFYHAPVDVYGPLTGNVYNYCLQYGYKYNAGTHSGCFLYTKNDAGTQIKITGIKAHVCAYGHENIVIPDTIEGLPVTEIADEAFINNTKIKSISIPATVKKIGAGVFSGCKNLVKVTADGNIYYRIVTTSIGENNMRSIVIFSGTGDTLISYFAASPEPVYEVPDSVTKIASGSFAGAENLETIRIGAGVSSIASDAFNGCTKLSRIEISSENRYFTTDSKAIYNADGTRLITYLSYNEEEKYTVPSTVKTIGERAFYGNTTLQRVIIPASVRVIEANAFFGANRLITVTIQGGLSSLGNYAFSGAISLTSLYVEDDITAIGREVFAGDNNLVIYSPNGENIGLYAVKNNVKFNNCYSASVFTTTDTDAVWVSVLGLDKDITYSAGKKLYISIPPYINGARVQSINEKAFAETSAGNSIARLTSIYIPETVQVIGSKAFADCTSLVSVYFGGNMENGIASIAEDAFQGTALSNLTFYFADSAKDLYLQFLGEEGVRRGYVNVKMSSDQECIEYANGTSGESTKIVTGQSQHICDKSHNFVEIPAEYSEGVPVVGIKDDAFSGQNKIYTVTIDVADGVDFSIGKRAFKNASGLTSITFSANANSYTIGEEAFAYAEKLTTISIPENIKSIGKNAFAGCTSLTTVFFPTDIASRSIGETIFGDLSERVRTNNPLIVYGPASGSIKTKMDNYPGVEYYPWTEERFFTVPDEYKDDATMTCVIKSFTAYSELESVVIPYTFAGYKVVGIDDECFSGRNGEYDSIKQIVMGENITSIGLNAFVGMRG
ncbi:MAG TPA: hypothetical protein DHV31_03360, partial [Clostridiales bacterium]|nr:hypothetical protein [Clostridiales bacterium]